LVRKNVEGEADMSFEIVTDTGANLPENIIEENNIHMLTLSFMVDGKEYFSYEKGKTTDLKEFYRMMREKKNITTSLVNTDQALEMLEPLLQEGKDVLCVAFSSGLSGTCQSTKIAAEELSEKYPERKIYVVDTLAAALGQGLMVYFANKLRKEGKSIEEVRNWLEDNKQNICHWITVDDLFFLKRGGRISATSAIVGSALSIKPIIHLDSEGHLINVEKARGRKKSLDMLLDHFEKTAINPGETPVFISHGDCLEDAQYVVDKLKEKFGVEDTLVNILDPVIGAHAGPGTVALFYYGECR